MAGQLIYEALADAFVREGVDTQFTLMGHGQMHWTIAMSEKPGMKTIHARHEHCAAAMATGYAFATGKVGIASVTCGPGFTQIITALTSAAQARVPLIVLAADAPMHSRWYNQDVDQRALTLATGAHYIEAHSPKLMLAYVQEAFYVARYERKPVVLSIPYDLLKQTMPEGAEFPPSSAVIPQFGPMPPNQRDLERLADRLAAAERPIIVAGRGAVKAGAQQAIEALAEAAGALLATTLPARGFFDDNPFGIGVAGGFAREIGVEQFAAADLVVAIGASLTHYTTEGGKLFKQADVAQVDEAPLGLRHGLRAADIFVRADAKLAAEALTAALKSRTAVSKLRTPALAKRIAEAEDDSTAVEIEADTIDPREVVRALDKVIPKDWEVVSGTGHSSYFYTHLRNRRPERLHLLREFGAIGSSLAMAIGVAAAKGDGKVVLLDGDGGLIMHIQELETVRRHGIKLLVCALNDGAYGAEIHKLRNEGRDPGPAIFGRPDFASIAQGFGLGGAFVQSLSALPGLFAAYDAGSMAEIWDIPISDRVVSPRLRKYTVKGYG
jgi:thiamine pyrophosphate-dependent acetolactate synthase large subunit-like protein